MTQHIFEVDSASFDKRVLARSGEVPVLVDFWADWCAPCKMLMPVLQKIVDDSGGGIELAKVNTDQEQELAARFGVRSLPTVMLFRNGKAMDQFMGAQSESEVRRFVEPYLLRESDNTLARAVEAWQGGRQNVAMRLARDALAQDPAYDAPRLQLADWLLATGDLPGAEEVLSGVSPAGQTQAPFKSLAARLELEQGAAESGGATVNELTAAVAADGADLNARYQLALLLVARTHYGAALEQLLEIVRRDKRFRDGAARKAMLKVFETLGGQGELVSRYRGLLARALN